MTKPLVLLAGSLVVAAQLSAGELPLLRTRAAPDGTKTEIFIPASAVLDSSMGLSASVPQFLREMIAQYAEGDMHRRPANLAPVGEAERCGGSVLGEMDLCDFPGDTTSPQSIYDTSKAIVAGRISAITPGFFSYGAPGSLLEISDLTFLKRDDDYDLVSDRLYVRHPFAQFRVGSATFCGRSFQDRPQRPAVGDRIVVFAFRPPFDEGGIFVFTTVNELVVERTGDPLHIPSTLASLRAPALTMDALVDTLKRIGDKTRNP
jgi:hypothetical protein